MSGPKETTSVTNARCSGRLYCEVPDYFNENTMKTILLILASALLTLSVSAQERPDFSRDTSRCLQWFDLGNPWSSGALALVENTLYISSKCDRGRGHDLCLQRIKEFERPLMGVRGGYNYATRDGLVFRAWSEQGEYHFTSHDLSPVKVEAAGIISPFVAFPIVSAGGWQNTYGCVIRKPDTVEHPVEIRQVESPTPSMKHEVSPTRLLLVEKREVNGVDLEDLRWALRHINVDPSRIPHLEEFGFSEEELIRYVDTLSADIEKLHNPELEASALPYLRTTRPYGPLTDRSDIYRALPGLISSIGPDVVGPAISLRLATPLRVASRHRVVLVNEVEDTLICEFENHGYQPMPFNLPWTIHYRGQSFLSFNPELARMLIALLPKETERNLADDARDLLYTIGWYLAEQRAEGESE